MKKVTAHRLAVATGHAAETWTRIARGQSTMYSILPKSAVTFDWMSRALFEPGAILWPRDPNTLPVWQVTERGADALEPCRRPDGIVYGYKASKARRDEMTARDAAERQAERQVAASKAAKAAAKGAK